jgi:hypothetical protein
MFHQAIREATALLVFEVSVDSTECSTAFRATLIRSPTLVNIIRRLEPP